MQQVQIPPLADAGICLKEDGALSHHVILMPGDNDDASHAKQMKWAASVGADLPSPQEQSLLRANLPNEFKRDAYWSNQKVGTSFARFQHFGIGTQDFSLKSERLRARRVRRFKISPVTRLP